MLEFEKEKEKVVKGADAQSVELVHRLGPFESNAAPIPMNMYVASAPVIEYAPAPDVHAAPAPVNESVASSPVIEYVTPPQLQFIEKTVEILDFLLCQRTQTAESSEIAPVRHVSFVETVAYAALAKYNAPASTMAYRVQVAQAPVTQYNAPAPTVAYRVHAAPAPVTEYDAPALAATYRVHAAPAPMDEYDAPAARAAPSPLVGVPVVQVVQVPQVQVVEKTIEIPQLQIIEKSVEIPEIQTVQCTQTSESLGTAPVREVAPAEIVEVVELGPPLPAESAPPMFATAPAVELPPVVVEYIQPTPVDEYVAPAPAVTYAAPDPVVKYVMQAENSDIIETSEKRTLRISSADCEGVIEELSKAMEEGLSVVTDEYIENCDKPEGLTAVIDECFEKFDKPDKKYKSDECVCGKWASEKGESKNFRDSNTNRLTFEELVDDSGYLHGWLDRTSDGWQARLASHDIYEEPWYSPTCGKEPEDIGNIHVRLLSETKIEIQIKFSDEAEWQPPVVLILTDRGVSGDRDLWGPLA